MLPYIDPLAGRLEFQAVRPAAKHTKAAKKPGAGAAGREARGRAEPKDAVRPRP